MHTMVYLFKKEGKVGEKNISDWLIGTRPLLGEAIHVGDDRFMVVDVSWDFDNHKLHIAAMLQEEE